jgi:hypothetical protein
VQEVVDLEKKFFSNGPAHKKQNVDSAGIEPATLSVLTTCDNPYTTRPLG